MLPLLVECVREFAKPPFRQSAAPGVILDTTLFQGMLVQGKREGGGTDIIFPGEVEAGQLALDPQG